MAATTSSYSITMRLHTAPDHGVVGAVATAIAAGRRHRHRDRRRRVQPRPARRRRHLLGQRRRPRRGARARRSTRSTASRSTRSATGPSCSTSAARSRSPPRCRCATATTCRWPTRRASAGSAWRSPSNPEDVCRLTIKGNTVAVVTDGSAVLGLGNIGPGAALPVMEGKAALFKRFADIDAWPICLATQDTDEIVQGGRDDRARLRRHQPRGHRRPALLRDRGAGCARASTSRSSTTTSTAPRSWCSPR